VIDRLDHLVLTVADVDRTCEFYRRVLRMAVVTFADHRRALRFGAQKINLHQAGKEFEPRAARPTPGSADICLLTSEPLATWVGHVTGCAVAILEGPVTRSGAMGPIESIYLRDPDGNLVEIARPLDDGDGLEAIRDWLRRWQACVRALDFDAGRGLCAPDMIAFGTRAAMVRGIDNVMAEQWRHVWPGIRDFTIDVGQACGAVAGDRAWVAAPWDSRGVRADGSTFPRPGRLTIAFERQDGRWLATHTHFSLAPARG
jgi:catechol 2,3-dioxygenase-like lactoylglutathione lyase family enzyme/ketosteroid isomerase-like protein